MSLGGFLCFIWVFWQGEGVFKAKYCVTVLVSSFYRVQLASIHNSKTTLLLGYKVGYIYIKQVFG